jgi:nitrate reductase delta subunit
MTTPRDTAAICQAASMLLEYPDGAVRDRLPLITAAVSALPASPSRAALTGFLDHVAAVDASELAEHYVATFDRRRRCCLYLTWWTDGDTRRRGEALAALKARYRAAGLELRSSELPDFLPVVLEYAATADLTDGLALLQQNRPGLELLRLALRDVGSPYAAAVEAVCELLPGPSPKDRAAAEQLARTGPPRESVGLEPYAVASDPARNR